jgi:hypothetical protein
MASMNMRDEQLGSQLSAASVSGEPSGDANRLSRRAAMRAAAGGAAAAGVFLAPRLTDATISPAYASAASGEDGSDGIQIGTVTQAAPPAPLCLLKCCVTCWNTTGVATTCGGTVCTCGTHKSCGSPTGNSLTGQLSVLELDVTGIDPPFQSCTVAVVVDCSAGTEVGGTNGTGGPESPVSVVADGPIVSVPPPRCSGSLQPQSPDRGAQEYCPAPATVTITLSCTFS